MSFSAKPLTVHKPLSPECKGLPKVWYVIQRQSEVELVHCVGRLGQVTGHMSDNNVACIYKTFTCLIFTYTD